MAKTLDLNIISAEKTVFSGKVTSVGLPGTMGGFSIHPDHAPLISSLKKGILYYQIEGEETTVEFQINGGLVEVVKNLVTVCVS